MKTHRRRLFCTTAFLGSMVCIGPAIAQTAGSPQGAAPQARGDTGQLPEVVVVARRVNENIQKVPASIGVISPQMLQQRNILSLNDIHLAVANLSVTNSPQAGGNEIAIRGVEGQSIPNATVFSGIGIYIDGVYMGRPQSSGDTIADISRVEVLRGPQGTLFGRNSSGGAVNFITGEPTETPSLDATVGLGNYDETRGMLTVNTGRFASGFTARMSYTHEGYDGDVKNLAPQNTYLFSESGNDFKNVSSFGGRNADAVMGKVRFDGLSGFTAEYKFDWSSQEDDNNGGQLVGYSPGQPATALAGFAVAGLSAGGSGFNRLGALDVSFSGPETVDVTGHLLTLTERVNDNITLKSLSAYRTVESHGANNEDGVSYIVGGVPLVGLAAVYGEFQHEFSEEFQLLGNWRKLSYIAGLYYFNENASYDISDFFFGSMLPAPAVNSITSADILAGEREKALNSSTAAYGHVDYALTDQWDFTAGVRYTVDNQKAWDYRVTPGVETGARYTRPNYDVTLTYSPESNIHAYFRHATGYTSGGSINQVRFRPEDGVSDEIGVKSDFFDRRLRVNAAAYYAVYTDEQLSQYSPNTGLFIQNIGNAKIAGAELEISAKPIDPLTLTANIGYNNPEYSSDSRVRTPRTTINLSADYKAWTFDNGAYVSLEGDGDYRSRYYAIGATSASDQVAQSAYPLPASVYAGYPSEQAYYNAVFAAGVDGGYWLGNARLSLNNVPVLGGGKFRISAYVRNITDNAGKVYGVVAFSGLLATFERPRTFGVELSAHF